MLTLTLAVIPKWELNSIKRRREGENERKETGKPTAVSTAAADRKLLFTGNRRRNSCPPRDQGNTASVAITSVKNGNFQITEHVKLRTGHMSSSRRYYSILFCTVIRRIWHNMIFIGVKTEAELATVLFSIGHVTIKLNTGALFIYWVW